jgi:hypothetical protein
LFNNNLNSAKNRGTITSTSLLELQNQVEKLPVQERVALIQHIKHTLTATELEAFWVEEAEQVVDLVESGQMATFTVDELRKRRAARTASRNLFRIGVATNSRDRMAT